MPRKATARRTNCSKRPRAPSRECSELGLPNSRSPKLPPITPGTRSRFLRKPAPKNPPDLWHGRQYAHRVGEEADPPLPLPFAGLFSEDFTFLFPDSRVADAGTLQRSNLLRAPLLRSSKPRDQANRNQEVTVLPSGYFEARPIFGSSAAQGPRRVAAREF